jgi:endogenous inhibitor of DNA gyrase (YacG/DUF329 family)
MGRNTTWSIEEDDYLRANYKNKTQIELGRILGRSMSSINGRLAVLDLRIKKSKNYTKEENDYLRENYKTKTNTKLAKILGRTTYSVSNRLGFLGLHTKCKQYSKEEIEIVKKHSNEKEWLSLEELLKFLPERTIQSIGRARRLLYLHPTSKQRYGRRSLICPICGKVFEVDRSSHRKGCSVECGNKIRGKIIKEKNKKLIDENKILIQELFQIGLTDKEISEKLKLPLDKVKLIRKSLKLYRTKSVKKITKKCKGCGKLFTRCPSVMKNKNFCSVKCLGLIRKKYTYNRILPYLHLSKEQKSFLITKNDKLDYIRGLIEEDMKRVNYIMPAKDPDRNKKYKHNWYLNHKKLTIERSKIWRENHKEELKIWRKNNPDKIKKYEETRRNKQ